MNNINEILDSLGVIVFALFMAGLLVVSAGVLAVLFERTWND